MSDGTTQPEAGASPTVLAQEAQNHADGVAAFASVDRVPGSADAEAINVAQGAADVANQQTVPEQMASSTTGEAAADWLKNKPETQVVDNPPPVPEASTSQGQDTLVSETAAGAAPAEGQTATVTPPAPETTPPGTDQVVSEVTQAAPEASTSTPPSNESTPGMDSPTTPVTPEATVVSPSVEPEQTQATQIPGIDAVATAPIETPPAGDQAVAAAAGVTPGTNSPEPKVGLFDKLLRDLHIKKAA